jgi:glycosyltransferase involved in cell wall biosynthesis
MTAPRSRVWRPWRRRPLISVVVVIYDMEREAKRTLYSLSAAYQVGIDEADYEVVVVDNGSPKPFPRDYVESLDGNFRHYHLAEASASPTPAINFGAARSRGRYLGLMIDGARMLTPGVLGYTRRAIRAFPHGLITTLAWHLGPELQNYSLARGYSKQREDELLARIAWPHDGYRLFEIAVLAASSELGWFRPIAESNCMFMSRQAFEQIGGYDERFSMPGGGLVNQDAYLRASSLPGIERVVILGEGSFHQVHGGIATNALEHDWQVRGREWIAQYELIKGVPYSPAEVEPQHFIGHAPSEARGFLRFSGERLSS